MDRPIGVLIVDDQAPFRRAARAVVERTNGFEVAGEAESGEDAVEQVRRLAPDLVLLDINLPGINGIETARRIADDGGGTVVILLSTYQVNDLPADALTSGAAAYLHKEEFGPGALRKLWEERGRAPA